MKLIIMEYPPTQLSEEQKRKGEKPSYEIEQLERPLQPSWVGLIT